MLEEYERRSQYYRSLVKEVGVTSKEIRNFDLLKLCLQVHLFILSNKDCSLLTHCPQYVLMICFVEVLQVLLRVIASG